MAESSSEPRFDGWGPRFIGNGIDSNDYAQTLASIATWADWHDAWRRAGDIHAGLADEALAAGHRRTAGEAFARAALTYHCAKFVWTENLDDYRTTTDRSIAVMQRAMLLLDPTFERWSVAFDRDQIVANVRRPPGTASPPLVIIVPGLDSTKEELRQWEELFLQRGVATASLDGPGQGEAGYVNPIRPDYEAPIGALLDSLAGRTDLDMTRVGLAGLALGDYYVARAAAFEPRVSAVAGIGGAYRMPKPPPLIWRKFKHSAQLDDDAAAADHAALFTLDGIAASISQPYLVVCGGRDHINGTEGAQRKVDEAAAGILKVFPEGGVGCHNVGHIAKPYVADWLSDRLGGTGRDV